MLGYIFYGIKTIIYRIALLLSRFRKPPDYVVFILDGEYPDFKQPPANLFIRLLQPEVDSLLDFSDHFQRIALEPRIKGVVFLLRPLQMSLPQIETLRGQVKILKEQGKRIIFWSFTFDTKMYFLASVADEILLLPSGQIEPLGLKSTYPFLAESLKQIGIQADFIPIAPYKTAGDIFARSSMSEEMREMVSWLLDGLFGEFVKAVQQGREVENEPALDMIDRTPCTDEEALDLGIIDGIYTEEELPKFLGTGDEPANLEPWEQCKRRIPRLPPTKPAKSIAIIPIEGLIVDGRTARPPIKPPIDIPLLSESRAGDLSIVQSARKALTNPRIAGVVVYVNSSGGSATASKKIHAALSALNQEKPVVISMGSIAGSGGYYVSASGCEIYAQPSTVTGSIGVVLGKIVFKDLLDRLAVGRETLIRGEGMSVWDLEEPFTDPDREKLLRQIERIYKVFIEVVSEAREISEQEILKVADGKVWTGRQAGEINLVDELGGLESAIQRARELAKLPPGAPVHVLQPDKHWIPPSNQASSSILHILENWHILSRQKILLISPFWFRSLD